MKLVLHIGTEKTGTTLLQQWLYDNRQAFSDQGVFLSDVCGVPNNRALVSFCQNSLDEFTKLNKLMTLEEKSAFFNDFQENFDKEVERAAANHDVMVITSEHFHSRLNSVEELSNLKSVLGGKFESVKVVCYLRPQWDLRESLYSTALRYGYVGGIESFHDDIHADSPYYNYYNLADSWANTFGRDSVDMRLYDKENFADRDLRRDFVSVLPTTIDTNRLSFDLESANRKLSYLQCRAFSGINKSEPFWLEDGGISKVNQSWKDAFAACESLDLAPVSDPRKTEMYEVFADSNRLLSKVFFDSKVIFPKPKMEEVSGVSLDIQQVGQIVEDIAATSVASISLRRISELEAAMKLAIDQRDAATSVASISLRRISELEAAMKLAIDQRDHARKFPWKYLKKALVNRFSKS